MSTICPHCGHQIPVQQQRAGQARAAKMTARQRQDLARKAAKARWEKQAERKAKK